MTNFPPIIVRWLIYLIYIYIRNRTRFSKISIIHLFLNYLLFKSICQKIIILKKYLRLHITNQRYRYCSNEAEKRKKKKKMKNLLSSIRALWERGDPCFRFRKYLNARDRYGAASYETSCSRIYVCPTRTYVRGETFGRISLSLSLFLEREKRKWYHTSLTVAATPVYRLTLEPPRASIHRPRLERSEARRKGHFGPVTDAFLCRLGRSSDRS